MSALSRRPAAAAWLIVLVLAVLAPLYILGKFPTLEWSYVFAFLIAMVGLNLLTGFCGQISLGNSAFMAIGGYTAAILVFSLHWNPPATIPAAPALSGARGILLGGPAPQLRGRHL